MVEAVGVGLRGLIDSTQVIEKPRRTTCKKRRNSRSDVHGVYMERHTQKHLFDSERPCAGEFDRPDIV